MAELFDTSDLTSVNQSALLVALRRAAESMRPDALFHDAVAESLAERLNRAEMSATFWAAYSEMEQYSGDAVALRTRHYDDQLIAATARGIRQVVMLGVGLDARSLRLNVAANTRFFEVDEPALLRFRRTAMNESGVASKYDVTTLPITLPADNLNAELVAAGFRPEQPTVVVAEGLLFYLAAAARERFITAVTKLAAPGSLLLADYPAGAALTTSRGGPDLAVTADFATDRTEDPWSLLQPEGWSVNCCTLNGLALKYGRALPIEIDELRGGARWWYLDATRW